MAEIELLSHSAINVNDLKEAEEFYTDIFGAESHSFVNFITEDTLHGRSVHQGVVIEDYLFAVMIASDDMPMPPKDQHRGALGFRHGFTVSRDRFGGVMENLKSHDVPFEGPVDHPEQGPFGQSIYFKDPSGNFFEVLWRRIDRPS